MAKSVNAFAKEFGTTTAEAARYGLYLLVDAFGRDGDRLEFYTMVADGLKGMQERDARDVPDDRQAKRKVLFERLEQARLEGLLAKNYAQLPQTARTTAELEYLGGLLEELDRGDVTLPILRRRVRHYIFNRIVNAHDGGDSITPATMEEVIAREMKQILND